MVASFFCHCVFLLPDPHSVASSVHRRLRKREREVQTKKTFRLAWCRPPAWPAACTHRAKIRLQWHDDADACAVSISYLHADKEVLLVVNYRSWSHHTKPSDLRTQRNQDENLVEDTSCIARSITRSRHRRACTAPRIERGCFVNLACFTTHEVSTRCRCMPP